MKAVLSVARLTAAGGSRATSALPVVAFAVTTALLLTVLGGAQSFFAAKDDFDGTYQSLAGIAVVLLIVPLITLGGSAARLCARRRDEKLSTLRLLGATPGFVRAQTVLESTVFAALGAVIGVAGYFALAPLVGLLHFRGSALGFTAMLLPVWVILLTVLAVVVLALISAAIGLRKVVISPLGVRNAAAISRPGWLRLVFGAGGVVLAVVLVMLARVSHGAVSTLLVIAFMVCGFGLALGVINLIGPLVLRVVASIAAKAAGTPAKLMASRTVLVAPKAAWRQVSAVATTTFVAVFAGVALAVVEASTATAPAGTVTGPEAMINADVRTGVFLTIGISFLMVACSVGISQASEVLDRKATLVGMDRLGVPQSVMSSARTRSVLLPMISVCIGSAVLAALVIFPLTAISLLTRPVTLVTVLACLAAGVVLVWLAIRSTRPLVRGVLRETARGAE